MIPVQVLDGIGAGMLSVAVPGLVARILDGTGHINVGQGAVMAAQGLGGASARCWAGPSPNIWVSAPPSCCWPGCRWAR